VRPGRGVSPVPDPGTRFGMSDASDRQDVAEALDADKIVDDRGAEDELGDYPPDAPMGVEDYGVTDREEAVDEPLAERVAREEPDPLVAELDRRAAALDEGDDAGESLVLVDDDDNDVLTAGTGTGEQTAEEAALHVTDQP
jgi:hypothetical protein